MLIKVKQQIAKLLADASGLDEGKALATLEMPKNEFGDLSSRIAFVLAGEQKKNPMEVATDIVAKLPKNEYVSKIEIKGPYINFYFSDKFYTEAADEIVKQKEKFGRSLKVEGRTTVKNKTQNSRPKTQKVMIEYFHANTHKGVHIGHIRNVSLGEALCRILEFTGNEVIRANFQGDIGPHVAKCLWGYINIYHEKAPEENRGIWLGKVYSEASIKIKGNEQLEHEVKDINVKLYAGDKKLTEMWKKTRKWCLDDFEKFYKEFGVKFNELYFESQTEKIGTQIVKEALKKGIAKEDQGAVVMDLKEDNLGVYVLLTKEGYPLYSTKDLGLAKIKFDKYELDKSIHVVGKEQEFHFKQLFKTFEKFGMKKAAGVSYHLIYDLVMLPEGKMSSREGTMVLYDDLKNRLLEITKTEIMKRHEDWNKKQVEETAMKIALAAIKFTMVRREHNKVLIFDWDHALNLEGDSGPYLQYAYVRTTGILDGAGRSATVAGAGHSVTVNKSGKAKKPKNQYSYSSEEKKLLNLLARFPEVIESSAVHLSTITLADYLLHLAAAFNKFYATSHVLNADKEDAKVARLTIVKATNETLKSGLDLLGIECPERM